MAKTYRVGLYFRMRHDFDENGEWAYCPSGKYPGRRFYTGQQAVAYRDGFTHPNGYKPFITRDRKNPDFIIEYSVSSEAPSKRKGHGKMAQKTFHIELRCIGVDDEEKFNAIKRAAQSAARQLHAQAMLVCAADSPPQIILYGEDFINGKKEIEEGAPDADDTEEKE